MLTLVFGRQSTPYAKTRPQPARLCISIGGILSSGILSGHHITMPDDTLAALALTSLLI